MQQRNLSCLDHACFLKPKKKENASTRHLSVKNDLLKCAQAHFSVMQSCICLKSHYALWFHFYLPAFSDFHRNCESNVFVQIIFHIKDSVAEIDDIHS